MFIRRVMLFLMPVLLLLAGLSGYACYRLISSSPLLEETSVTVPEGAGAAEIGAIFEQTGIIHSALEFAFWSRVLGMEENLRAGNYTCRTGSSMRDILEQLQAGTVSDSLLTMHEGMTSKQFANQLFGLNEKAYSSFLEIVNSPSSEFRDLYQVKRIPSSGILEGYLFPDTYRFDIPLEPGEVITRMTVNWSSKVTLQMHRRADSLGLGIHGAMTLASIIEKETGLEEERRRISAVFWNRLKKGMKLEADPTVAFALGKDGTKLTLKDLEVDSPYNTYRYPGLPPGPICNSGLASITAALDPLPECRDLFFVATGVGGSHNFSRTLEDHLKAVSAYRKKSSSRKRK